MADVSLAHSSFLYTVKGLHACCGTHTLWIVIIVKNVFIKTNVPTVTGNSNVFCIYLFYLFNYNCFR